MNKIVILFVTLLVPVMAAMAQADQKLIDKANKGDVKSMVLLARCYENGAGVQQDSTKALQLFKAASEKGSAEASAYLSGYYLRGTSLPKDTARYLAIRQELAAKGEPRGMAALAIALLHGTGIKPDTVEALRLIELAAKKNDEWALGDLADFYYYGILGYKVDQKRAIDLWKKAAKQNSWFAMMRLGDHYASVGEYDKAWEYINEGMRWNYPGCISSAIDMYFMGMGVAEDEEKAQKMAVDLCQKMPNVEYPYYVAGRVFMIPDNKALRDSIRAMDYWRKGDALGSQICRQVIARMMIHSGQYAEAKYYLERMLNKEGDDYLKGDACLDLSQMYYMGWGVEENKVKAMDYLYRGADEYGSSQCARTAASLHSMEYGDKRTAEHYYRRAIELGDNDAYIELAELYANDGNIDGVIGCYNEMIEKGNVDGYYYLTLLYANLNNDEKTMEYLDKGVKNKSSLCLTMKGRVYEDGYDGKDPDYKKAAKYYEQGGTGLAFYRLGLLYINGKLGKGSDEDMKKALGYLKKSADMNYIDAIQALGYCYETGTAVEERDYGKALEYYKLLADNDVAQGIFKVGNYYESGLGGLEADSMAAIAYYRRAADMGHGEALCYLGDFHRIGQYLPLDKKKAFEYYLAADSTGEEIGTYYVGRSYLEGCGVDIDTAKAIPYLKSAAAQGVGRAAFLIADFYNYSKGGLSGNGDSAVYYYWKAHNNGSADASLFIGRSYVGEQQYAEAAEYFSIAARRGSYDGAVAYAVLQQKGLGVKEDPAAAYRLFELVASRSDNSAAYYQMGLARMNGLGCAQNEQLGKRYLDTAAALGNLPAMNDLSICYMNGYGCMPDTAEAIKVLRRAVEAGSYDACNRLGNLYEVREEFDSAVHYFQLAVDRGSFEGMCNLGYMYQSGRGVILSHKKAFDLYSRAAENGYGRGFLMIALCYIQGINVEEDAVTALGWFIKAAEAGNVLGMYYSAMMLEEGEDGIERNLKKAKYWYQQAAARGYEPAIKALERM